MMKKTILTGLFLATLGTASISAKTVSAAEPQTFTYRITYVTETVGNCKVTYKVTTTYLFCIPLCSSKCEVSRTCGTPGGGGNG